MNKQFRELSPEGFFPLLLALGQEKEAQQYLRKEQKRLQREFPFFYEKCGHLNEERLRHPETKDGREQGYQILRHRYFGHLIDLGVPFTVPPSERNSVNYLPERELRLLCAPAETYVDSWLWLQADEVLRKSYSGPCGLGYDLWDWSQSVSAFALPVEEERKVPERRQRLCELLNLPESITNLAEKFLDETWPEARGGNFFYPEKKLPLARQMNKLHRLSAAYVFENFKEIHCFKEYLEGRK